MKKSHFLPVGALVMVMLLTGCKDLSLPPTDSAPISSPADSAVASDPEHSDNTADNETATTATLLTGTGDTAASTATVTTNYTIFTSATQASRTQVTTAAHTHTWAKQVIAPSCETEGYTVRRCSCGKQEKIDRRSPLGHAWGDWTVRKAATKTETGLKARVCGTCKKEQTATIDKLPLTVSDMQQEVFRLVNAERAAQGLSPLTYYTAGQAAGDIRARELGTLFSHTRPNGSSCFTALDELNIHYVGAGENIASGYTTPAAVMAGWMDSSGHRANILNGDFNTMVVGYNPDCKGWVQLFMTIPTQ